MTQTFQARPGEKEGLILCYLLDSMKEIVLEDKCKKIEVEQLQFIRDKKKWNMKTQVGIKKFSNTFDKRIVLENKFETLPFGL